MIAYAYFGSWELRHHDGLRQRLPDNDLLLHHDAFGRSGSLLNIGHHLLRRGIDDAACHAANDAADSSTHREESGEAFRNVVWPFAHPAR